MAKTLTAEVVVLDDAAQVKFDRFLKQNDVASKGRRAGDEASKLKKEIVAMMGDALLAELPDGRRIQRVRHDRDLPAKKASSYHYFELVEITDEA